ncbi:sensor histidine kinase [Amycolatopsis vancoresmycina]|uniref:histidine kinase n=1 Tax=Amycolatopsis vancoresmycina DSM 44592 TaxID=1292037 RepID=R1HQY6_9PSEU|nr:histidine kinase [Amycolatopsis vancoresmycina]EOD65955.1 two-component system histidine kinase [Amycolatopsis vancoresmycina DSM 44592]
MIEHRAALARWRRLDPVVRDLPLGLVFLAAAFVPILQNHGTELGGVPSRALDVPGVGVLLLETLPLAGRRRWPALCLALVSLGFALDQLRGYHSVAGTALGIALVSAGAHISRRRRTAAVAFSAAYVLLSVVLHQLGSEPVAEYVTFYVLLAFAWGIGAWLRSTRAAEAERRRRVAADTLAAERTRIARELHDVVTHHVTAMVVQAEAARYLTAAPERLAETLTAITGTGRRAITDLRHLLDLLNPDHGEDGTPPPGGLRPLVEHARQAGQPVEFTEEGTPAESAGSADLVAYRVVQEALTNALKHARGCHTEVRVRHGEREIEVEIATAGPPSVSPGGSGRGLAGLRERVGLLGGDFSADADGGAGFVVRARIPTGSGS